MKCTFRKLREKYQKCKLILHQKTGQNMAKTVPSSLQSKADFKKKMTSDPLETIQYDTQLIQSEKASGSRM
jgi:hypothetical protein